MGFWNRDKEPDSQAALVKNNKEEEEEEDDEGSYVIEITDIDGETDNIEFDNEEKADAEYTRIKNALADDSEWVEWEVDGMLKFVKKDRIYKITY